MPVGDVMAGQAIDPDHPVGAEHLQERNLDLLLNVMAAAQQGRVRRVVFASSNFVVAGHRFAAGPLTTTMEPAPINPYGASKLFGERIGRMFAECYGLSFIAFRIENSLLSVDHTTSPGFLRSSPA